MYLHIREHREARNYIPIDLDKVELIRYCIWADDETGEYCTYEKDHNGKYLFRTDSLGRELTGINRKLKTKIRVGRIQLINTKDDGNS